MNFKIVDNKQFYLDGEIYPRQYYILVKNNGRIKIQHIRNYSVLVDDLDFSIIKIGDTQAKCLEELRCIIFNRVCMCNKSNQKRLRLFSPTFIKTFI